MTATNEGKTKKWSPRGIKGLGQVSRSMKDLLSHKKTKSKKQKTQEEDVRDNNEDIFYSMTEPKPPSRNVPIKRPEKKDRLIHQKKEVTNFRTANTVNTKNSTNHLTDGTILSPFDEILNNVKKHHPMPKRSLSSRTRSSTSTEFSTTTSDSSWDTWASSVRQKRSEASSHKRTPRERLMKKSSSAKDLYCHRGDRDYNQKKMLKRYDVAENIVECQTRNIQKTTKLLGEREDDVFKAIRQFKGNKRSAPIPIRKAKPLVGNTAARIVSNDDDDDVFKVPKRTILRSPSKSLSPRNFEMAIQELESCNAKDTPLISWQNYGFNYYSHSDDDDENHLDPIDMEDIPDFPFSMSDEYSDVTHVSEAPHDDDDGEPRDMFRSISNVSPMSFENILHIRTINLGTCSHDNVVVEFARCVIFTGENVVVKQSYECKYKGKGALVIGVDNEFFGDFATVVGERNHMYCKLYRVNGEFNRGPDGGILYGNQDTISDTIKKL